METILETEFYHREFTLQGFAFWGGNIGIKDHTPDFGVTYSEVPAVADAVFTQNRFPGAPIIVGRKHIRRGRLQAVVVNSKNANVCTGKAGERDALTMCRWGAEALGISDPRMVIPSSTGIIGKPLDMSKMEKGFADLSSRLLPGREGIELFARAIMTSDAYPKWGVMKVGGATLVGVVKGAGMIEPHMATMLAYFFTDARIPLPSLRKVFREAVDNSFHAITVDGDTSTSDTAVILANGLAGKVDMGKFYWALNTLSVYLAQLIAADGEGAHKLIELRITHSRSRHLADAVAKSVLNSPLVKTAVYGADPNWGRLIMAVGKVDRRWIFDARKVRIYSLSQSAGVQGRILLNDYQPRSFKRQVEIQRKLKQRFSEKKVILEIDLGNGRISKTFWGSDLGVEYVKYNSDYTS